MIRLPVAEAERLRFGHLHTAWVGLVLTVVFTLFSILILSVMAWLEAWDWVIVNWVVVALLFIGGASSFAIIFYGIRMAWSEYHNVIEQWLEWVQMEIENHRKVPEIVAAPTLPALAAPAPLPASRVIPVTAGGSRAEVALELVNGFDPRALRWLAEYLANGNKFTEAAMEKLPLPYSLSGEVLGKAEGATPYYRLMTLCVERGIIVGRAAEKRQSGELALKDAREIYRRLCDDLKSK